MGFPQSATFSSLPSHTLPRLTCVDMSLIFCFNLLGLSVQTYLICPDNSKCFVVAPLLDCSDHHHHHHQQQQQH